MPKVTKSCAVKRSQTRARQVGGRVPPGGVVADRSDRLQRVERAIGGVLLLLAGTAVGQACPQISRAANIGSVPGT